METNDTTRVEEIGSRLKTYRRERNLSQEELADLAGLSIRTIQRLEKGESVGSAYTLRTLARALQLTPEDLIAPQSPPTTTPNPASVDYLLRLNWSALAGIILPLANIILPAILLWRHRHDQLVKQRGRQILSFQIIWTLSTLLMMLVIPLLLAGLSILVGMPFPLFIPVYVVSLGVNLFFVFRIALQLPNQPSFLDKLPIML
ncbi:helix-turn-helix domain-containing protein [Spirosoma sp. KNUC1025]|uniref:helix-turn-helix domain-containing protein n=1 Tax=Spirosoma sp. KNUC1025 TaxID=2894082 RepID=UPI001E3093CE|nr:helix-turn-helix domain-containing protein [Spirosoma sp. KNUC1025]UFH57603.1 helix-turn-helix domain-containing protein [Spirosoma sp. KNUC1025]